jgi:hypothetical protein
LIINSYKKNINILLDELNLVFEKYSQKISHFCKDFMNNYTNMLDTKIISKIKPTLLNVAILYFYDEFLFSFMSNFNE